MNDLVKKNKNKVPPLDKKIENLLSESSESHRDINDLIDTFTTQHDLLMFMELLRENQSHRNFMMLHRYDLFGTEENVTLPYFYFCTPPHHEQPKIDGQASSKALSFIAKKEALKVSEMGMSFSKLLGIRDNQEKEFLMDLADLIAYFSIRFIRSNNDIKKLINAKDFNFTLMKEKLQNYRGVLDFTELEMEIEALFVGNDLIEIDTEVYQRIDRILTKFLSTTQKDIVQMTQRFQNVMPNVVLQFHLISAFWLGNILRKSGLSFNEYMDILDDLHMNKLITNLNMVHWCEDCCRENNVFTTKTGQIAPSKFLKIPCLTCSKPESFSCIYQPNSNLVDAILSRDGFLSIYLGWLLKHENIRYDASSYSDVSENDFIIHIGKQNILIEVKMYKQIADDGAIKSRLGSAFTQIKKHIAHLQKSGTEINRAYLLWNLSTDAYTTGIESLESKFKELFKKYKLEVVDHNTIEKVIKSLKK